MMCPNSAFSNPFSSAAFNTVVHTASVAAAPPSTPRNSHRLMRPTQPAESETIPLEGLVVEFRNARYANSDRTMTGQGQSRLFDDILAMSGLPPDAVV